MRGRMLAARNGQHGLRAIARWVGSANGSSVESQHREALAFWQEALALTGADALSTGERAFAEAEIARHEQALAPLPLGPKRTEAV